MSSTPLLDAIVDLRQTYPKRPFVVLVPKVQHGYSLAGAMARCSGAWEGVTAVPPAQYARQIAALDQVLSGASEVLPVGRLFHAADILERMAPELQGTTAPGAHHLARTVAEAVHTLRLDAVEPDRIHAYAAETSTDRTMQIVADGYEAYVDILNEQRFFDDATVFEWAEQRIRSEQAPGVENTVFVLLNAVDLPQRAYQFVDALRENGAAFVRTGASTPHRAPRESALMRFPDADVHEPAELETGDPPTSFVRAVGTLSEADAVMRDILTGNVPFDDITIAYTTSSPYASLLRDRAERAGIPALSGPGQPALLTRTGRALNHLYEWVREDFAPPRLVAMLREGLIRFDHWNEAEGHAQLSPAKAASMIAERSYETGRMGLLNGLRRAVRHAEEEAQEQETDRARLRAQRQRLVYRLTAELVDLMQPETLKKAPDQPGGIRIDRGKIEANVTLQDVARGSVQFLERFGPVDDVPDDTPEEQRTLDQAARNRFYEELLDLQNYGARLESKSRRVASLLQKWISTQNVQPQQERPGHVHILPLESIGYSDRSHLYVVGMDSASFDAPVGENGLLGETDRHILQDLDPDAGRSSLTAADELLWRSEQALARHRGPVTFYTRTFDVNAGEECDPSAFFLAKERSAGENCSRRAAALIPSADDLALSGRDVWLAAYAARREHTSSPLLDPGETARDRLKAVYPRIVDGEAARAARASEEYTEHDGLLPPGTYDDLDLLSAGTGSVSASRLQTLAESPYIYFLKYVLGVRPLEEPALDDEPWLNSLRKGNLLHAIYERFVQELDGRVPDASDEPALLALVDTVLEEEATSFEPPSEMVKQAARQELVRNARVFFRAERIRDPQVIPTYFELGFGVSEEENNPFDPAPMPLNGDTLFLQGKIDRVDRHAETGALTIWDYKTGKAESYDESDPLQKGKTLQWALYAYAMEALTGETVERSGYFFANTTEVGARISFDPAPHRAETRQILDALRNLTRTGTFPVTPRLKDVNAWMWNGYDRLVQDLDTRRREVRPKSKAYPEDRPKPPGF
jgi:RecB family exonuclease